MSAADGPGHERTMPSFVGPASLLGVGLGMIAWLVPAFYAGESAWLLALPLSGLLMMFLPIAAVRHLGSGLVASVLVWPYTAIGLLTLPGIFG